MDGVAHIDAVVVRRLSWPLLGGVVQVIPVTDHILGTMAGGAADCTFWLRYLSMQVKQHSRKLTRVKGNHRERRTAYRVCRTKAESGRSTTLAVCCYRFEPGVNGYTIVVLFARAAVGGDTDPSREEF